MTFLPGDLIQLILTLYAYHSQLSTKQRDDFDNAYSIVTLLPTVEILSGRRVAHPSASSEIRTCKSPSTNCKRNKHKLKMVG